VSSGSQAKINIGKGASVVRGSGGRQGKEKQEKRMHVTEEEAGGSKKGLMVGWDREIGGIVQYGEQVSGLLTVYIRQKVQHSNVPLRV
jgi:hypothetical protein